MRQLLYILAIVPISLSAMNKSEAQLLVEKGNIAYSNGEHQVAAQLYDSVLTSYVSAELYYNLGNAYFKMNELPRAILNYERAWKLAPGDEDIYYNMRAADRLVIDELGALPLVDLGNSWKRFQAGEYRDQWAQLSIFTCLLGFLLLAAMVVAKPTWLKRIVFFLSLVVFIGCIASVIFATLRSQDMQAGNKAVIFAPKVDVRSEPNEQSTRLFILHEGSKVDLEDEEGEWIEVRLPNGSGGWMRRADVEVI